MPLFARISLEILLLVASLMCIVFPLVLGFWQIYFAPERHVSAQPAPEELLGTVLGVLVVDLLLYVLYRPALPRHFFYAAMIGLNGFCLLFACHGFIAWWLYQKALHTIPPAMAEGGVLVAEPEEGEAAISGRTTLI
ncbi:MAG TPA: hypothetical protein VL485_14405 [Ktedonobacteraceae bacterium]|jgi:hypothetical protein|nr:hypothetical protein [Ktedonobacteraceae bacterium]